MDLVTVLLIGLPILIFSAMLHEVVHGFVADRLGDPTARLMGRLTLNPLKHIDPFMSILLPVLLLVSGSPVIFGGAKPVPVDPFNLKDGKKDLALVSLAGPLTNICIAIVAAFLLKGFDFLLINTSFSAPLFVTQLIGTILKIFVQLNLYLAIFNLLPIPPLDGSKVFAMILPDAEARTYLSLGNIGIIIIFILLSFPIAGFSLGGFINQIYSVAIHLLGI